MFFSCTKQSKISKITRDIVNEWVGKQVLIPSNSVFTRFAQDTVDVASHYSEFTILVYVDSIGCAGCKMGLDGWSYFIDRIKGQIEEGKISVLFYVNTTQIEQLKYKLLNSGFSYPICIDPSDSINKINHFPKEQKFQTFLLDDQKKVILIGNPFYSSDMYDLYMKYLQGDDKPSTFLHDQLVLTPERITIDIPEKDTFFETSVLIENKSNEDLMFEVKPSCDCITVFTNSYLLNKKSAKEIFVNTAVLNV